MGIGFLKVCIIQLNVYDVLGDEDTPLYKLPVYRYMPITYLSFFHLLGCCMTSS